MKLIVSDFDGTFFDSNYEENVKFINKIKNDYDFVIATGRNIEFLDKDLKMECKYYICNDGGYILNSDRNLIYRNSIDDNIVNQIYKRILDLGYNEFYFDSIDELSNVPISNVNKILIRISNNENDKNNMNNILDGINKVYGYISTNWINIMSTESTKDNSVDYISRLENYDTIYVIGNDINDYKMLKKYNGYLISNKNVKGFNIINCFEDLKDIIKIID